MFWIVLGDTFICRSNGDNNIKYVRDLSRMRLDRMDY